MPAQTIAIISENDDFAEILAEHAERELGVKAVRVATAEKADALKAALVITPEMFEQHKPLRLQKVLAGIEQRLVNEELMLGDATFSVQQKTIVNGKKTVSLTDKEAQLLLALLKNKAGVAKDVLLKDIWSVVSDLESHTLETHVYRLRAKLKEAGMTVNIAATPGKYVLEL